MPRVIYSAGRQYIVPDDASERNIRQLTNVGRDRFLAVQNPEGEGYEILDENLLKRKRDLNLISLPRYRQGFDYRRKCIDKDLKLLSSRFDIEADNENLDYFAVLDFPLGPGWSRPTTTLLTKIPKDYPQVPPVHFFMKKGLSYKGKNPSHYFRDDSFNELADLGWGKYCLHIDGGWYYNNNNVLDGDSLHTFLELVKVVLDNMELEKI